ncbi:ATP-dependent DNA helicase [Ancylobacter defluvii]|uniref:ATP-binding protein n=1 Tax=Ancylobacter defluvii TaxID=1282440 RepID=A0A9W6K0P7_9HYPH|nr:AAA family ATPase [Ancylobacter defluvii]MBS7588246.1 AAA family ATPase [Ancylobacter defluvii]GLK86642.1 ATP-binding protein [Ancylobacter defluvii]
MAWSPQQESALKSVGAWLADPGRRQVFRLFGFAGTGKTTLAKEMAEMVEGKVVFACFTGKAALVLRSKGCKGASTIHVLIYKLDDDGMGAPKFRLNPDSDAKRAKLVIIDECSMVDEKLGQDLLSFGTPVLVLGDPAQLPPVQGGGFFTNHDPDVMLTEIHRQASENPIIAMAQIVREGGRLDLGTYGSSRVIRRQEIAAGDVLNSGQVLVGINKTRRSYNARIRELLGRAHDAIPEPGDRLVCLRNNHTKGLLNGGLWTVIDAVNGDPRGRRKRRAAIEEARIFELTLAPEDAGVKDKHVIISTPRLFFEGREGELSWNERRDYDEFDFGYALTVHKSQGSQWDDVIVFDESGAFRQDRARHLYTAITRAAERVTVVDMRAS